LVVNYDAEMNTLSEKLALVKSTILRACERSGRDSDKVKIIAVTKGHGEEVLREASGEGLWAYGESKVQEAVAKVEAFGRGEWHFIGHLQTNKVRWVPEYFSWVHSVDRWNLAEELNRRCEASGKVMKVLVQVNVAGEATKYGVSVEGARDLIEKVSGLRYLDLRGLMTIAPYFKDVSRTRPIFRRLRELRDEVSEVMGIGLPELSMGMSHDYEIAVEEGATMVRLGTVLFGVRRSVYFRGSIENGADDGCGL
jgi:pyridoxal phosphate enzyme (YggS family)